MYYPSIVILVLGVMLASAAVAQQSQTISQTSEEPSEDNVQHTPPPVVPEMSKPVRISATPTLAQGTVIPLRLTREVKVKEVNPGDTVDFVLDQNLWFRDTLLARRGTPVQVVVQTAEKAKWLSQGSKLGFDIQRLKLLNGTIVELRGEADYNGGINPVSNAAFSGGGGGSGVVVAGATVVGVFGLIAPGKNRNAQAGSRADAWVAKEILLDIDSFRPSQPERDPLVTTARIQVVRGILDRLKSRDFYCNGIPLAHLDANRKYIFELKPGWYRFAINPKKPSVEVFVVPGEVYTLVTLPDFIRLVDADFSSGATVNAKLLGGFGPRFIPRTAQQMVNDAKPVEKRDLYGDVSQCIPLREELVAVAAAPEVK